MFRSFLTALFLSLLVSSFAQTRMVPHVTPEGGDFETRFLLVNNSETAQFIELMLFTNDGTLIDTVRRDLEPGETRVEAPGDLAPGAVLSHFVVNNETPIEVTVSYQAAAGGNSAAHVGTSSRQAFRWRIYPATLGDAIDGLAVVNMDNQQQQVWVRQVGFDGSEIARARAADLAAKGKGLYLFNSDFTADADSFFEVFADGPLALTALRFSTVGEGARFFWETAAVGLVRLQESDNQAPAITGQEPLAVTAGESLTLSLEQLTIVDPDNGPEDFELRVAGGANYTLDGTTITPAEGFVGMLDVPVTCFDGTSESAVYTVQVTVNAAVDNRIGRVAELRESPTYGISGRAVIAGERLIRLENFSYNGGGPDVRVYLGQGNNFAAGPIISGTISGQVYNNDTLEFELPAGVTLDDFDSISIWCTLFSISFSEGTFE
ncbi:DM13 domain-containing protein [Acanthopleuribacter pedis]|uniref:DM13 domain-containing protein n=1 Tax=Acanthopleuribacter pedis TaxID=442870 RepID=A0A8J7QJV5_9BACT|nr:DM13 domain-containing protein [Acanthopleuribacter pedis]MBO1319540.1 DM13 domain-containing protein [Acanthopleuribacter pedis]